MKKLIFIAGFLIMSVFGHSQTDTIFPMNINVGAAANDGTGDKVRVAFQKTNANFSDIYQSVISGPVNGTKYTDLRKGVKRASIDPAIAGNYYYIKTFINGADSGIHYHYKLEIGCGSSPYLTGIVLGSWEYYSDSLYTIEHRVGFSYAVTPGGITGNLVIDFSELTAGATYTGSNFTQTGIYATFQGLGAAGGGGIEGNIAYDIIPRIDAETDTVNGESSVYIVTNDKYHMIRIDSVHKILQPFTIKVNDSNMTLKIYHTVVKPLAGAKINDKDSIVLFSGDNLIVYPDSLKFHTIITSAGGDSITEHHFLSVYQSRVYLDDDASIQFFDNAIGNGTVYSFATYGEFASFNFDNAGIVTLHSISSANAAATDTDGKLCIFDTGDHITIRNRIGAACWLLITINFYIPI